MWRASEPGQAPGFGWLRVRALGGPGQEQARKRDDAGGGDCDPGARDEPSAQGGRVEVRADDADSVSHPRRPHRPRHTQPRRPRTSPPRQELTHGRGRRACFVRSRSSIVRPGRSSAAGMRSGMRAAEMFALVRVIRALIVVSCAMNARAILGTLSPPTVRSISASCASMASARWQQMKNNRRRS